MRKRALTIDNKMADLKEEVQTMLEAAADADELKIVQARKTLVNALEKSAKMLEKMQADVAGRARRRDNDVPGRDFWQTLGLAFALGAFVAYVHLGRSGSQ